MNRNEQELIQRLKEKTDHIEIPDSVRPEHIKEILEEKDSKKKKISPFRIGTLAAACLVLAAGIAVYRSNVTPDNQGAGVSEGKEEKVEISKEKTVASAADYDEVYAYIERYKEEREAEMRAYEEGMVEYEAAADEDVVVSQEAKTSEAVMSDSAGAPTAVNDAGAASGGGYSETNVRQEGVDEGDVVKTDGTYLYVRKDNGRDLSIVDTRGGEMKEVQTISVGENEQIQEVYLNPGKKTLVLICSMYDNDNAKERYWYMGNTEAITYDIADPEKPQEKGRVTQSGQYQSSRMADGYLYLFSYYSVAWDYMERTSPETFIPLVNDAVIAEKDICLPPVAKGCEYTVVSSVDVGNPSKAADSKAILSQGGQLYVSGKNIYYYETVWNSYLLHESQQTTIRSISYKDGVLTPGAQGTVRGYINDSFSIDEYKDYLRVVVTDGDVNGVYVLDKKLETVGSIDNLAKDERVYSARLMGDTGYFVTFRETDPLFSVDLSDPENPEIIGSLKIPGFSDYLHPYGEGRLLGIGMNVDEETMITDGVKLTMFDISDPADVKEQDTYILKNVYGTDVSYDYKACLADAAKNIIGFAGYTDGGQNYYIFEYDPDNGFICKMEEEINGNGYSGARGVYIDQTLYVVEGNIIEAYSLKDYKKVDDIIL